MIDIRVSWWPHIFIIGQNISEDTARYLFYTNAIIKLNLSHKELLNIQQEISYSTQTLGLTKDNIKLLKCNGKNNVLSELDSYFDLGKNKYAIEFEYHRKLSKTNRIRNIPQTRYAGQVFNDINRLSLISSKINKYFIYIIDDAMIGYHFKRNKSTCLYRTVFDMNVNNHTIIEQKDISSQPKGTVKEAYKSFNSKKLDDVDVTMIYKEKFSVGKIQYQVAILKIN